MDGVAIAALLVAYSNTLNLWPPFNGVAYVPLNLTAAAVLYVIATGPLELDGRELGLIGGTRGDLLWALGAGAMLTLPLFVAVVRGRGLSVLADERVRGLWGASLAYQALVRVPLGTAFLEELAFRGVLLGAWLDLGHAQAVAGSSAVFGLWHVSPTINLVRANHPHATRQRTIVTIMAAVVVTAGAGVALAVLRLETSSVYVPFALHATVNSLATVAGARAHRRREFSRRDAPRGAPVRR